jgi:hypothetical protein
MKLLVLSLENDALEWYTSYSLNNKTNLDELQNVFMEKWEGDIETIGTLRKIKMRQQRSSTKGSTKFFKDTTPTPNP